MKGVGKDVGSRIDQIEALELYQPANLVGEFSQPLGVRKVEAFEVFDMANLICFRRNFHVPLAC